MYAYVVQVIINVLMMLRFSGDLNLTGSLPTKARQGMWMLLSAIALGVDGVMEFDDVVLSGSEPTLLHDATSPLWVNVDRYAIFGSGEAATWRNLSYHEIVLFQYALNRSTLLDSATNAGTKYAIGTSYYAFIDTLVEWVPPAVAPTNPAFLLSIILPSVLGGSTVLVVLAVAMWLWHRQLMDRKHKHVLLQLDKAAGGGALSSDALNAMEQGHDSSGGDYGSSSSKARGATISRIEQAKRNLEAAKRSMLRDVGVMGQPATHNPRLVLECVLGEGTFGKVYKGDLAVLT